MIMCKNKAEISREKVGGKSSSVLLSVVHFCSAEFLASMVSSCCACASCARRVVWNSAKVRPCSCFLLFCVIVLCASCARERFILCERDSVCERERETDRGEKKEQRDKSKEGKQREREKRRHDVMRVECDSG